MYETFPKKGRNMTGEQRSASFAPTSTSTEYNLGTTASKTAVPGRGSSRRQSHEKGASFAKAGGNHQVSAHYPSRKRSFSTEKSHGSFVPMAKPKKA